MEILILLALMGALYAFMIVPQQRKMKAHRQLLNSLKEGDVVITSAGIYGAVAEVEDAVVWIEVAPEVELKISKGSITEIVSEEDGEDDYVDEDDEDDEDDDNKLIEADADDSDA